MQLRFDAKHSTSLPDDVRNRQDAIDRLIELIKQASEKPKKRIKTKQSMASKRRILEFKRHRSKVKKLRQSVHPTVE